MDLWGAWIFPSFDWAPTVPFAFVNFLSLFFFDFCSTGGLSFCKKPDAMTHR
tara:strand:- start:619 stop:774 length:156 start_codon:yes stop_codon:yes gene_type:complete